MAEDDDTPALDRECFFITPIGEDGSSERRRADGLLESVVQPACEDHGLEAVRADRIAEGGHVTLQVLEHCVGAKVAVADLTGGNRNVLYEVGLRHALRMPVVLVAEQGEGLPFDLLQQRTIFYVDDIAGTSTVRAAVSEQLGKGLGGHVDSPVQAAVNVQSLASGDALQQVVAELVTKVDDLASQVRALAPRRRVVHRTTARDPAVQRKTYGLATGNLLLTPEERQQAAELFPELDANQRAALRQAAESMRRGYTPRSSQARPEREADRPVDGGDVDRERDKPEGTEDTP